MKDRRSALQEVLVELIEEGKEIVCVSVDSASRFKKVKDTYPQRVIECGICEQTGMGVSAGLALQGFIPVISGYATFLTMRALEQIRTDICRWSLNVKICGTDVGFAAQYAGFTHQAFEDIAILSSLDNLIVCEPCDWQDTLLLGRVLFGEIHGPVYVRFGAREGEENFSEHRQPVEVGCFEPLSGDAFTGADIVVVTLGQLAKVGAEVVNGLEKRGYQAFLFNARFVKPISLEFVAKIARRVKVVVTIEEHSGKGGLGDNLLLAFHEVGCIPGFVKCAVSGNFGSSGKRDYLLQKHGLDASSIVTKILQTIEKGGDRGRNILEWEHRSGNH